jgi:hypothetical protein
VSYPYVGRTVELTDNYTLFCAANVFNFIGMQNRCHPATMLFPFHNIHRNSKANKRVMKSSFRLILHNIMKKRFCSEMELDWVAIISSKHKQLEGSTSDYLQ